jgi:CDGSH-type Zn-finger protein
MKSPNEIPQRGLSVRSGGTRIVSYLPASRGVTLARMATKVSVSSNGPIRIEGDFEILDPAGAAFGLAGRTVISLCRCGQSANKPFCDGSHARTGFNDAVAARDLPPPMPKL